MTIGDNVTLKKFDLEAALKGAPVINGRGESVLVTKLATPVINGAQLISQLASNGIVMDYHYCDGSSAEGSSFWHLYMAPTKRTVWVNFYVSGAGYFYDSKKAADDAVSADNRIGDKAYPIEIEE